MPFSKKTAEIFLGFLGGILGRKHAFEALSMIFAGKTTGENPQRHKNKEEERYLEGDEVSN